MNPPWYGSAGSGRATSATSGLRPLGVALTLAVLLTGCAGVAAEPAPGATSPTPTPTAACPQVEGHELPPECAPYDPDHARAQNDRHRERMELSTESRAAAEEVVGPLRIALEEVRASGTVSADGVQKAIEGAGLSDIQMLDDYGTVLFGAGAPKGGCIFGAVSADAVVIEAGGYIMDGGCLPAQ